VARLRHAILSVEEIRDFSLQGQMALFSWRQMAHRYDKLFQQLVGGEE
jgi:hypothetical protein